MDYSLIRETVHGHEAMAAVDAEGNVWIRATDIAEAFGMTHRNIQYHMAHTMPVEWRTTIPVETDKGERQPAFLNQYAITKLAALSRKAEAQHFADEIIQLGVRAKRGDLSLAMEIIEEKHDEHTQEWVAQRLEAKISNKLRNAEIVNRTKDETEQKQAILRLAGAVNKVTTGRTAKQIQQYGSVKNTRDALSPAQLALQRFVELSQIDCMKLHDAQGFFPITRSCDHLHEETEIYAKRLGLHNAEHIRDRTQGGRLKVPGTSQQLISEQNNGAV